MEMIQKQCPEIDLNKYFYEKDFNNSFDDDEKDIRRFISNLNEMWIYSNPNNCPKLKKEEFISALKYLKTKRHYCSTIMFGLDEIKWSKDIYNHKIEKGTYGYDKAKSYFGEGYNYLSNSIIISKVNIDLKIDIYISYKVNEEDDYYYLQKVQKELGKPKEIRTFYAPTDSKERIEWNKKKEEAKSKYLAVIEKIQLKKVRLPNELHSMNWGAEFSEFVNVRKLIKEVLFSAGWESFKKYTECFGIPIKRTKGESEIELYIDATHKGHYLQTQLVYRSKYYWFLNNINYDYYLKDEEEVRKYLENIKVLGDYIYDQF